MKYIKSYLHTEGNFLPILYLLLIALSVYYKG